MALLIRGKCDLNRVNKEGMTALHWASFKGHLDVVKQLTFTGKMQRNVKNAKGKTAWDLAREKGHKSIVSWLNAL